MDELGEKISQLLSSPDTADKIRSLMSSINHTEAAPAASGDALSTLMPLIQNAGIHDKNADLLRALKPYLRPERAARIDEAIRLLRLMKLLPLLGANGKDGSL